MRYKRKVDNKMKSFGETDFDKKSIRINKKKSKKVGPGELLDTILHEEEHRKHPKRGEKSTKSNAERLAKKLTPKLKQAYYDLYPNK